LQQVLCHAWGISRVFLHLIAGLPNKKKTGVKEAAGTGFADTHAQAEHRT
jgi:hypothetical protein